MRDPAIKLFGKEISLPENDRIPVVSGEGSAGDCLEDERVIGTGDEELGTDKDSQREHESLHDSEDDPKTPQIIEENENKKTPDTENKAIIEENGNEKTPDSENEANLPDQKPLKKPDKILPCPRCNSTDTKFCYYNNYNVNQPRHFCKGCHRYWTAGGTMRNVPVGAGRRKNKNSVQITISKAIAKKVISFGHETKMGQKSVFRNGGFGMENENGSDCSSGTSVITTSSSKSNISMNQVSCLQGYPWPYPAIPNPGFCSQYPIPVYPIPYWPIPIPNTFLGKHSRNGDLIIHNNRENIEFEEPKSAERSILIPKTLRIDDPDEAAKSSIWATLGIKNDFVNRKGFFKAFEAKCDENKNNVHERSSSMRANPAAMSRSLNFLETA